jgi:mRNA-degrading endonuclease RelE of RelBE toxin-antitoxin system
VSDAQAPKRIAVSWSENARDDVRRMDKVTAIQVLYCLDRFLASRVGNVKELSPPLSGLRLRCGDYRLAFTYLNPDSIEIDSVRHRREAYR